MLRIKNLKNKLIRIIKTSLQHLIIKDNIYNRNLISLLLLKIQDHNRKLTKINNNSNNKFNNKHQIRKK